MHAKTALGTQELRSRNIKMTPRLRMMLVMIDGQTDDETLRGEAAKVGAPADFLEQLLRLGLIAPVGAGAPPTPVAMSDTDRFVAAKEMMTTGASGFMGLKTFFFILKLEKCGSVADLRALLPDFVAAIAKAA